MNQFTIAVLVLVVFCYFGGKYCPSVLKQNKQILLGVVGGLVLASFFGFKLEALKNSGGRATQALRNLADGGSVSLDECCLMQEEFGEHWDYFRPREACPQADSCAARASGPGADTAYRGSQGVRRLMGE
jgi:hypothetical protein